MRTILRILVNALALWLTTLIVGGPGDNGVWVTAFDSDTFSYVMTLLIVALIFGIVNATLGLVLRIVSLPLFILTLGLFALIVNGVLLLVVAGISDFIGFGLSVGGFWWGVLAALVLSILSSILGSMFGTKKRGR